MSFDNFIFKAMPPSGPRFHFPDIVPPCRQPLGPLEDMDVPCALGTRVVQFITSLETLDYLFILCAGEGAKHRLQNIADSQFLERLATQSSLDVTKVPWVNSDTNSDSELRECHRSFLKPWKEPNFGIVFRVGASTQVIESCRSVPIVPVKNRHATDLRQRLQSSNSTSESCSTAARANNGGRSHSTASKLRNYSSPLMPEALTISAPQVKFTTPLARTGPAVAGNSSKNLGIRKKDGRHSKSSQKSYDNPKSLRFALPDAHPTEVSSKAKLVTSNEPFERVPKLPSPAQPNSLACETSNNRLAVQSLVNKLANASDLGNIRRIFNSNFSVAHDYIAGEEYADLATAATPFTPRRSKPENPTLQDISSKQATGPLSIIDFDKALNSRSLTTNLSSITLVRSHRCLLDLTEDCAKIRLNDLSRAAEASRELELLYAAERGDSTLQDNTPCWSPNAATFWPFDHRSIGSELPYWHNQQPEPEKEVEPHVPADRPDCLLIQSTFLEANHDLTVEYRRRVALNNSFLKKQTYALPPPQMWDHGNCKIIMTGLPTAHAHKFIFWQPPARGWDETPFMKYLKFVEDKYETSKTTRYVPVAVVREKIRKLREEAMAVKWQDAKKKAISDPQRRVHRAQSQPSRRQVTTNRASLKAPQRVFQRHSARAGPSQSSNKEIRGNESTRGKPRGSAEAGMPSRITKMRKLSEPGNENIQLDLSKNILSSAVVEREEVKADTKVLNDMKTAKAAANENITSNPADDTEWDAKWIVETAV